MPSARDYLRRPYARLIMPDDSGLYAAQILEFPGCFAEGDSIENAYRNLESAAESWIDAAESQGMEVPEPFASQGFSGTVSLRLPRSIHKRAAEFAHRDGVSLNQFLVSAIAARVGAEDLWRRLVDRLDGRLDQLLSRQTRSTRIMMIETEAEADTLGPGVPAVFTPRALAMTALQDVRGGRAGGG